MSKIIPDQRFSSLGYVVMGYLLKGPKSEADLRKKLRGLGWAPTSDIQAGRSIFMQLERAGFIQVHIVDNDDDDEPDVDGDGANDDPEADSVESDEPKSAFKRRLIALTRAGFEHWCQSYDFCEYTTKIWANLRKTKQGSLYATLVEPTSNFVIDKTVQRSPTAEERDRILKHAAPDLVLIYTFGTLAKVRATDLINARIEEIKWSENSLQLEPKSVSGRVIKIRLVKFGEAAKEILKKAIGDRLTGYIFVRKRGNQWKENSLTIAFKQAREAAGVERNVVMSGSGGKVGLLTESSSDDQQ